jgi:hypothetical protein
MISIALRTGRVESGSSSLGYNAMAVFRKQETLGSMTVLYFCVFAKIQGKSVPLNSEKYKAYFWT